MMAGGDCAITRTLDAYMDVLLGLFGLSGVVVGFGEGVCIVKMLAYASDCTINTQVAKVHRATGAAVTREAQTTIREHKRGGRDDTL